VPGSSCPTLYEPSSLVVTVFSLPVLLSLTTTVAPGIAPLASDTVPTRRPVLDWPNAVMANKMNVNPNVNALLMKWSPCVQSQSAGRLMIRADRFVQYFVSETTISVITKSNCATNIPLDGPSELSRFRSQERSRSNLTID